MRLGSVVARAHVQVDGTMYEPGALRASEAEKITSWTGYSAQEWEALLVDGDPVAAKGLLALVAYRKGEHPRWADIDVEDIDSIHGELRDDKGRLVTFPRDDNGEPLLVDGKPVILLDGEPADPQMPAPLND